MRENTTEPNIAELPVKYQSLAETYRQPKTPKFLPQQKHHF